MKYALLVRIFGSDKNIDTWSRFADAVLISIEGNFSSSNRLDGGSGGGE